MAEKWGEILIHNHDTYEEIAGLISLMYSGGGGQSQYFYPYIYGLRLCAKKYPLKRIPMVSFRKHAKKVLSNSLGLVDFALGLVNFVLSLPDGQVKFFENSNYRRTVKPAHQKAFGASQSDVWAST